MMTNDEALDFLKRAKASWDYAYSRAKTTEEAAEILQNPNYQVLAVAIEAVRKRIPEKPIRNGFTKYCPCCGKEVYFEMCLKCGQTINDRIKK